MLVLSRKPNEKISFPNLGISVEVLRVGGKAVRIGVDAPRDVRVLRSELVDEGQISELKEAARKARHDFRNRIHTAQLALMLLQKQLEVGHIGDAEQTLVQALESLSELDQAASEAKKPEEEQPLSKLRALVVEDNANERELLAGYLRLCGYQVDTVDDGAAALDYLSENDKPDVVLLDMQMPRMNGQETVEAIRNQPEYQDIKLFAVSGSSRNEVNVPMGDEGVDRWFEKPLNPAEFAKELDQEITKIYSAL